MNRTRTASIPHTSRALLAAFGFIVVALLAYAPSARAATLNEQLDQAESVLNDLAGIVSSMMEKEGQVLGASTTKPVPVRPVCRLTTDKKVYTIGDTIKISWKSTGASYATFVPDESGKDNLTLPADKLDSSDSLNVVASVFGLPAIMLKVVSETGHSRTCVKYIAVNGVNIPASNVQATKLQVQKMQILSRLETLNEQREKINAAALQAQIDALILEIQISQLLNVVVTPDKPMIEYVDEETSLIVDAASSTNNKGEFILQFDVTAVDSDMYVPKTAARGVKVAGANYRIIGSDGKAVAAGTATGGLSSSADVDGDYYVVQEGETESFSLMVVYNPLTAGFYKLGLTRVNWNDTMAAPDMKLPAAPAADFETDNINI